MRNLRPRHDYPVDTDALEAELDGLVRRLRPALVAFLERIVVDPWAADDVTQDVLIKVCSLFDHLEHTPGPARLRHPESLDSWIFAVARNAALDYLEKERRTRRAHAARGEDRRADDSGASGDAGPFALAVAAESRSLLHEAVGCLSDRRRAALQLCAFEELDQVSAAGVLQCKPATVNSRVARAREHLRASLRPLASDLCPV